MIEINNLTKKYGSLTAVNNITLSVDKGEICSFLGVNGAGKTTTLRMLAGILRPTSGRIHIGGHDLAEQPLAAKKITGYIPDRPYLYPGLTGREYLYFVGELYELSGSAADQRIDHLLDTYGLSEWEDELIQNYSHGMKQRLATSAAILPNPRVLIVDEPMVGLDPHGAKMLKRYFREYARQGMAIFISTHSLNVAEEVSDRLAIIHGGRILATGSLPELRNLAGLGDKGLEDVFLQLTLDPDIT